jgi:hypothetical protein
VAPSSGVRDAAAAPAVRGAHAIWLSRRASLAAAEAAADGPRLPNAGRPEAFQRIAAKVWAAVDGAADLGLTTAERALLLSDADALAERAEAEVRRAGPRDLARSEEWLWIARTMRDVAEASRAE